MNPTTFRNDFIARFGVENAIAILEAANSHKNGIHDNPGSDKLRWAILICIGHDCISRFHEEHNITCPWEAVRAWLKQHKDYLAAHDGAVDYFALSCGTYNEFMS